LDDTVAAQQCVPLGPKEQAQDLLGGGSLTQALFGVEKNKVRKIY